MEREKRQLIKSVLAVLGLGMDVVDDIMSWANTPGTQNTCALAHKKHEECAALCKAQSKRAAGP
jgi:hypothetical protein